MGKKVSKKTSVCLICISNHKFELNSFFEASMFGLNINKHILKLLLLKIFVEGLTKGTSPFN